MSDTKDETAPMKVRPTLKRKMCVAIEDEPVVPAPAAAAAKPADPPPG
jgi:hypothetical protein